MGPDAADHRLREIGGVQSDLRSCSQGEHHDARNVPAARLRGEAGSDRAGYLRRQAETLSARYERASAGFAAAEALAGLRKVLTRTAISGTSTGTIVPSGWCTAPDTWAWNVRASS